MQAPFDTDRTWQSAMAALPSKGEIRLPAMSTLVRPTYGERYFSKCIIRILERNGRASATVAWSDATSCCYGEQIWRRCVAKNAGVCALSEQTIARGDAVYRPRRAQPAPRNNEAMILATVMEATSVDEGT